MARRIRSVKPEWLEDERLGLASSDARVLSIALMLMADDEGRGRASPVMLGGQVFPGLANPREVSAKALEELRAICFVDLFEVDGQHYFEIRNWEKHQKIDHPTPSKLPKNPHTSDVLANPRESSRAVANPRASRAIHSYPDPLPDPDPEGVKGEGSNSAPKPEPVATVARRVFEAWKLDTGHHRANPDAKRLRRIEARLRDRFTEQDLLDALEGRHSDPWLMGTDPKSTRVFDDIDTLFRDAAQVERLRELRRGPGSAGPASTPTLTQAQVDAAIARDLAEKRAHLAARRAAAADGGQSPGTIDSALAAAAAARVDPFGKGGRS